MSFGGWQPFDFVAGKLITGRDDLASFVGEVLVIIHLAELEAVLILWLRKKVAFGMFEEFIISVLMDFVVEWLTIGWEIKRNEENIQCWLVKISM